MLCKTNLSQKYSLTLVNHKKIKTIYLSISTVAKMSGGGLGHTGGTIDKLESVKGFHAEITNEEFIHLVNKNKIARELTLDEKYLVGRVIARPFLGKPGVLAELLIGMIMH